MAGIDLDIRHRHCPARLLAAFDATATLVAGTARGDIHAANEIPGERTLLHRPGAADYDVHRGWCSVGHREIQNVETVTGTAPVSSPRLRVNGGVWGFTCAG
jgi:hypothetical protein